ncbi:hypothetical protein TrST_g9389 [Triparma strigata]|nr:hypothetical protein TrST_g9389 [Triparma strigata]
MASASSDLSSRLSSLNSLKSTIQSVDTLSEAVENPVKLMVMVSTSLEEYVEAKQHKGSNTQLSLPEACLSLIQEATPLFKENASMLFGCVVSSVISCFCEPELEDEVKRTLLMFIQFYGLQGFIVEDLAQHGMEHDSRLVRKKSVTIVPRLLKGIKTQNPQNQELLGILLEAVVGRVRDIDDDIVQSSLEILSWMWKENKEWFENKVADLGGDHEKLVDYYADQIYSVDTPNSTPATSNNPTPRPVPPPDSSLVFGFLPKRVASTLSNRNGDPNSIQKAIGKTIELFPPPTIPREHILPTLPLFVDTIMSHVTSPSKQTVVLAVKLLERIALFSPDVIQMSLDIMMPFFVSLLSDENQAVGATVTRILYRLCDVLDLETVLSHVSPALAASTNDGMTSTQTFLSRGLRVCVAGLLTTDEKSLSFDTTSLIVDLAPLLESKYPNVQHAAFEFFAVLQHTLNRTINVAKILKTMKLIQSKDTLHKLKQRLSLTPPNLPVLSRSDGKVTFEEPPPLSQRPPRQSNAPPPSFEYAADSQLHSDYDDDYEEDYEDDEGDNDSVDNDKFQKLMRVQSFGEMPMEMENTFTSIQQKRRDGGAPSISPIQGPPVHNHQNLQQQQQEQQKRGRRRSRGENDVGGNNYKSEIPPAYGGEGNNAYEPSWTSPPNSSSKSLKSPLPPKFKPPSVNTNYDDYDETSDSSPSNSLSPGKHKDPLDVVKRRQASRRAARRALSASDTDARRPRAESGEKEDLLHGPGTPVQVGKYQSDGSRHDIQTYNAIAHREKMEQERDPSAKTKTFDEDAPLKGGSSNYNLEMLDNGDEDIMNMAPPLLVKNNISFPPANGGARNGGGPRSGSESPPKMSLATRRRQERAKKEQQRANLRKSGGLEAEVIEMAGPVVRKVNSKAKPKVEKKRAKAKAKTESFDEMDKWAKDARTNNIQFEGLEHKGSSLRAENHEYMSTDDIRPSPNPQQELQMMLGGVGTQEWPELFHTLNSVRRLSLHHGQLLESHVHSVLRSVLKAVDNLRSTIAKNAMLTIADMWMGMGRVMDPELNLVAPMLVKRFADTNGFLSEVAEECIGTVITNASDGRCLGAFLLSASNKQPLVRAKAAAVILRCVNKFSPEKLASSRELGKLIQSLALFCQDRQSDTRSYGRQIAASLIESNAVSETKLQKALPGDVWRKIEQAMRNGLFNTPQKRLSIARGGGGGGGGGGGALEDDDDIFEVSGSNLNTSRLTQGRDRTTSTQSTSSVVSVKYSELEHLPDLFKRMRGTDWKERSEAVTELVALTTSHSNKVINGNKLIPIIDRLCEKLSDGNTKVNLHALEGISKCVTVLGQRIEPALGVLVPSICSNLARTPKLGTVAKNTIENMTMSLDAKLLTLPYCNSVLSNNNPKIKSFMLSSLASVVPRLCDEGSPNLAIKHIVPVAVKNCTEKKSDIKSACNTLTVTLYSCLGDEFINQVNRTAKRGEIEIIERSCGVGYG